MHFPSHKPKQIEFVAQRRKTDCGIACVAMLIKKQYGETAQLFGRHRGGMYPNDILDTLDDLGYNHLEIKSFPKTGVALVAIQWKKPELSGHFIVWDSKRKQFLDPLHGVVNKRDMLKVSTVDHIWKITRRKK